MAKGHAQFKELKKTKKFNGKIYKLHSETGYIKSAKEKASNLRKRGYRVSIVYPKTNYGRIYRLYIRKK
jgi:hypothetical protein